MYFASNNQNFQSLFNQIKFLLLLGSIFSKAMLVCLNLKIKRFFHYKKMPSDQQFYNARIFLKSFRDALSNLQEVQAKVNWVSFTNNLATQIKTMKDQNQIQLDGNRVEKGTNWGNSRYVALQRFQKQQWDKLFAGIDNAEDFRSYLALMSSAKNKLKEQLS